MDSTTNKRKETNINASYLVNSFPPSGGQSLGSSLIWMKTGLELI